MGWAFRRTQNIADELFPSVFLVRHFPCLCEICPRSLYYQCAAHVNFLCVGADVEPCIPCWPSAQDFPAQSHRSGFSPALQGRNGHLKTKLYLLVVKDTR